MVKLKEIFSSLGYLNVQTYIQSGNVVFQIEESDTKAIEDQIKQSIQGQFGFEVAVMVISAEDFREIMEHSWFSNRPTNFLHVTLLKDLPSTDHLSNLNAPCVGDEELQIVDQRVYLYCPNGYGRTKLTNTFFERKFSTEATTRNAKTMSRLHLMLNDLSG